MLAAALLLVWTGGAVAGHKRGLGGGVVPALKTGVAALRHQHAGNHMVPLEDLLHAKTTATRSHCAACGIPVRVRQKSNNEVEVAVDRMLELTWPLYVARVWLIGGWNGLLGRLRR